MCVKEILIKRLTETLNEEKEKAKQKWQKETRQTQKHQSRQIYHYTRETGLLHFKTLRLKC